MKDTPQNPREVVVVRIGMGRKTCRISANSQAIDANRTNLALLTSLTPWSAKPFWARSIPTYTIAMSSPSE
jgi:hypothetical protein